MPRKKARSLAQKRQKATDQFVAGLSGLCDEPKWRAIQIAYAAIEQTLAGQNELQETDLEALMAAHVVLSHICVT